MRYRWQKRYGFSILEVLLSSTIFVVVLGGELLLFIRSNNLMQSQMKHSAAEQIAENELAAIGFFDYNNITSYRYKFFYKNTSGNIVSGVNAISEISVPNSVSSEPAYDKSNFDPMRLIGSVSVSVNNVTLSLKSVRIVVCYVDKGNVVGEDIDLDGRLDSGEDKNGNGLLDGPVVLETSLAKFDA